MKKISLLICFIALFLSTFSQDFFNTNFDKHKKYVILTNPTVSNLKTIQFLVKAKLLDINTKKMKFVGVNFAGQAYDFAQAKKYLEENKIENFYLHEINGELTDENLFDENDCTPQLKQVFDNSAGVFFFGGPDIQPAIYGEENTLSEVTDPGRHRFETTFLFHLLGSYRNEEYKPLLEKNKKYLVTGFCLGMQTMNVATGGTMIQDIPAEIYRADTPEKTVEIGRQNLHRNYWQEIKQDTLLMGINLHTIQFTNHPFFGVAVEVSKNFNPRVLSAHHQAAEKIGKNLEVTAVSADGKIVEGLAHKKYPNVFAVQFHPEVPALYEDREKLKFHPDDQPMTYNDILGKKSVRFHEDYWGYISYVLRRSKN